MEVKQRCYFCGIDPKHTEVKLRLNHGIKGEYLCDSCAAYKLERIKNETKPKIGDS